MEQYYNVVFKGDIQQGYQREEVKGKLAGMLSRKDDVKAVDRLFSGNKVIIKKCVDYDTAIKFTNHFSKSGALCSIESIDEQFGKQEAPIQKTQIVSDKNHPKGRIDDVKQCSHCGKTIKTSAAICTFCNRPQKMSWECENCGRKVPNHKDICICGFNRSTGRASGIKICPECGEEIKNTAKKCRFCGRYFDKKLERKVEGKLKAQKDKIKLANASLTYAIIGLFCAPLGPLAIYSGTKALKMIKTDSNDEGKTKAKIGIIAGVIEVIAFILFFLLPQLS